MIGVKGVSVTRPVIDEARCVGCGACYVVCPVDGSVFAIPDKTIVLRPELCVGCGSCVEICPVIAITLITD
jgi:NAD-dependent dihydropyrimidine dehydrogenase PreA subunit